MKEQGACAGMLSGRIRTAIDRTNDIRASLTGSPYDHRSEALLVAYGNAGGIVTG